GQGARRRSLRGQGAPFPGRCDGPRGAARRCPEGARGTMIARRALLLALGAAGAMPIAASFAEIVQDARSGPDPRLRAILVEAVQDAASFVDRFDAEVWLTDMSGRLIRQVPDAAERFRILKAVHREATRRHLDPQLVLAVIDVESAF